MPLTTGLDLHNRCTG